MKKLFPLVFFVQILCSLSAEELKLEVPFRPGEKNQIVGWRTDSKDPDTLKLLQEGAPAQMAIQYSPAATVYSHPLFPCQAGDVFEMEVKAKGSGTLFIGISAWGKQGYVYNFLEKKVLSPEMTLLKAKIVLQDKSGRVVSSGRVFVSPRSDCSGPVIIESVKVDILRTK